MLQDDQSLLPITKTAISNRGNKSSRCFNYLLRYRTTTGTGPACAIVGGAAALVLEKFPHYTPAQVKQYLLNTATDGAINMDAAKFMQGNKGANNFLYVGNGM